MKKTFKLKYTELVGDVERDSEMIIETKDIKWTLDQFVRNRHVLKIEAKETTINK